MASCSSSASTSPNPRLFACEEEANSTVSPMARTEPQVDGRPLEGNNYQAKLRPPFHNCDRPTMVNRGTAENSNVIDMLRTEIEAINERRRELGRVELPL